MTPTLPFPLVEVEGGPRERGHAYGRAARGRIERSIEIYRPAFEAAGLSRQQAMDRAAAYLGRLRDADASLAEELVAIAEGADARAEEIVAINARTELLYGAGDPTPLDDGCTGAIALPPATRDGGLIHGQNWDWLDACRDSVLILAEKPTEGPARLGMMEAGTVARCGMNAAGLALTANFLRCDHDGRGGAGIPSPFVRRRVLSRSNLADAVTEVMTAKRSFSNNIMISHVLGEAVDLETTPEEAYWIEPQDGLLVHANHFASPSARARVHDTELAVTPDSLWRERRVREALSREPVTVDTMLAALRDDHGTPHSVCRPPTRGPGGDAVSTVASIVMDVTAGRMRVVPTPYQQSEAFDYAMPQ